MPMDTSKHCAPSDGTGTGRAPDTELPPIIKESALRARWASDKSPNTWFRWRREGRIPAPDVHLPDGPAWYVRTIEAAERSHRDAA
jgi:hypothetical protein